MNQIDRNNRANSDEYSVLDVEHSDDNQQPIAASRNVLVPGIGVVSKRQLVCD